MKLYQAMAVVLLIAIMSVTSIAIFAQVQENVTLIDNEVYPSLVDGSGNPGSCC